MSAWLRSSSLAPTSLKRVMKPLVARNPPPRAAESEEVQRRWPITLASRAAKAALGKKSSTTVASGARLGQVEAQADDDDDEEEEEEEEEEENDDGDEEEEKGNDDDGDNEGENPFVPSLAPSLSLPLTPPTPPMPPGPPSSSSRGSSEGRTPWAQT